MMTFEDFKKFIAEDKEDKKYFSDEKMYEEKVAKKANRK